MSTLRRTSSSSSVGRGAGFAGIPNPLFSNEKTRMLFGNAKETVEALVAGVKQA